MISSSTESFDYTIGGKIRRIRELRKLTQKELGMRCGFSEATSGVRIRQYESNRKTPRKGMIKVLAEALEVDEAVFFDADLSTQGRCHHVLFDLEDYFALHPVLHKGKILLEFGGKARLHNQTINEFDYYDFLMEWMKKREEFLSASTEDEQSYAEKTDEYDLWRYELLIGEAARNLKSLQENMRKEAQKKRKVK